MSHPLVLALFETAGRAAKAAQDLRELGIPRERVSIVARSHDEEGELSQASDASPGSEFEDSPRASRLGELSAHLIAAIAVVLPGIGPIVADGPLAAEFGEAAGHLAGGIARTLQRAGVEPGTAERWESRIESGAFLVGAHLVAPNARAAVDVLTHDGASETVIGTWDDPGP